MLGQIENYSDQSELVYQFIVIKLKQIEVIERIEKNDFFTSSSIHKGILKMDYKNTFEELFNLKLPLVTSPRKFCKKIY